MDRVYRIDHHGVPRHAIQRDGVWHLAEGDIFERYGLGAEIPASGFRLLSPCRTLEDRRRRFELP